MQKLNFESEQLWLAITLIASVLLYFFAPLYTEYIGDFYGKPDGGGELVKYYGYEVILSGSNGLASFMGWALFVAFCYLSILPLLSLALQLTNRDPDPFVILSRHRYWKIVSCITHVSLTILTILFQYILLSDNEIVVSISPFGMVYLAVLFWILLYIIGRRINLVSTIHE